jgi:hypothetical protein
MSKRTYLKPPWFARVVGNRMAAFFRPSLVSHLSVPGRRTGRWQTVPVAVLDHARERYLLAPRGETDWVLNLRASGTGRLAKLGLVEEITVAEVPAAQLPPLVEAYRARYGGMPTVGSAFRALPDPAGHPAFVITGSRSAGPAPRTRGADQ